MRAGEAESGSSERAGEREIGSNSGNPAHQPLALRPLALRPLSTIHVSHHELARRTGNTLSKLGGLRRFKVVAIRVTEQAIQPVMLLERQADHHKTLLIVLHVEILKLL